MTGRADAVFFVSHFPFTVYLAVGPCFSKYFCFPSHPRHSLRPAWQIGAAAAYRSSLRFKVHSVVVMFCSENFERQSRQVIRLNCLILLFDVQVCREVERT